MVQLADAFTGVPEADESPKWVQVTREGNFPGYMGGLKPFAFTRADLDSMVKNIREHPAYKLDANGNPIGHVIPWDYNHASEMDPTSGELPVAGAPAQGWTLDLEVRNAEDGTAELWALTQFIEPARSYVRAGQYKWASVAVVFNAIDPETSRNVGATVTSIALTNTPFVEGMESLVASKVLPNNKPPDAGKPGENIPGHTVMARRYFYEAAKTVSEAISQMRELFGIPETSGIAEVMQQITIVRGWFSAGGAPLGTDPEYIVGSLRTILNLPTLTPDAQVLDEAGKSIQVLMAETQAASGNATSTPPADSSTVPPVSVASSKKGTDAMSELLKTLSKMLGVREADDAVTSAAQELVTLRNELKSAFGLERDSATVILGSAKDAQIAKTKLQSLFTALGITDPEAAVGKVADIMESASKLKEVMPELEALRAEKKEAEEKAIETDVDEAIAASKLSPDLKPALLLYRRSEPAKFKEKYKPAHQPGASAGLSPEQRAQLTNKVANGGAAPVVGTVTPNVLPGQPQVVNLAMYPGDNPTAKAKAYLASTVPNWKDLTNEAQWQMAITLKKQPHVINQPVS